MPFRVWLTVENTPENVGRAREKRARLALRSEKNAKNRLTNQSIS